MTVSDQNTPPLDAAAEAQLEQLFAEARDAAPVMSDALTARMLADAYDAQPQPAPVPKPAAKTAAKSRGFGDAILGFLGGWSVATALVAASAFGISLGYASPDLVPGVFESTWVEADAAEDADPFETLLSELGT